MQNIVDPHAHVFTPLVFSRDEFRRMLKSVVANGHSFDECKEVLKQSEFDCAFQSVQRD